MNERAGCPFCRVPTDEIIAESPDFLALYNIAPILPGHCLVVPKRHAGSLMDLSDPEAAEFMIFGKKVAAMLRRAFHTDAFNWTIQEKEEAGQTIPHLHMHIIPRKPADLPRPGDWFPRLRQSQSELIDSEHRQRLSPEERHRIVQLIKKTAQAG